VSAFSLTIKGYYWCKNNKKDKQFVSGTKCNGGKWLAFSPVKAKIGGKPKFS
jgi:hypothetical protein